MGEMNQKFEPGAAPTLKAGATILGQQLLMVSSAADNTVIPTSGSVNTWIGVATQDAATGDPVIPQRGGVQWLIASGAIVRGDIVIPGAAGVVTTLGGGTLANRVGIALTTAANNLVLVAMDR